MTNSSSPFPLQPEHGKTQCISFATNSTQKKDKSRKRPPPKRKSLNQSINQSINQYIYNAPWYRGACYSADYAETKRNALSRILNVITDGAVRQFREREFQSLGAATEKRRPAVSKLCGGTDRNFCVDDRSETLKHLYFMDYFSL